MVGVPWSSVCSPAARWLRPSCASNLCAGAGRRFLWVGGGGGHKTLLGCSMNPTPVLGVNASHLSPHGLRFCTHSASLKPDKLHCRLPQPQLPV